MSLVLLILGLVMFIGLVVIHELGHFWAARRSGVEVEEFGIGFPPRAWGKKLKSGLLFSLNWLPLGGFVRLKGEHDADTTKGSYGAASLGNKTKIMVAGVFMNLVVAYLILTFLAVVGMPRLIENQFTVDRDTRISRYDVLVGYVEPGSPADKAGLQINDKLEFIGQGTAQELIAGNCPVGGSGENSICNLGNPNQIYTADILPDVTVRHAGKDVTILLSRGKERVTLHTTLRTEKEVSDSRKTDDPKGYLGIIPLEYIVRRTPKTAPVVAGGVIGQFTWLTLKGIGSAIGGLFTGHAKEAGSQVAGPVGIFVILKDGSLLGYQYVLMIIAIISLTLAIMNVLPIPALDGGRLFVTWLFRAIRKPLTQRKEEWIHGTGFAVLILLFIVITVVDVKRNF